MEQSVFYGVIQYYLGLLGQTLKR